MFVGQHILETALCDLKKRGQNSFFNRAFLRFDYIPPLFSKKMSFKLRIKLLYGNKLVFKVDLLPFKNS